MEDSILVSTKKILGLGRDYTAFDLDIMTHINGAFSVVDQLGVGIPGGYFIESDVDKWADLGFADSEKNQLHLVKNYIFLKVQLSFDPPGTSFLLAARKEQLKEHEWRLNVLREVAIDEEAV